MITILSEIENVPDIEDPLHKSIFEKAEPYLRTRHNVIHTVISYWYAMRLLSVEGGARSIVAPAILLHDVGWSTLSEERQLLAFGPVVKEPDLRRQHEIEGARLAGSILRRLQYPEDLTGKIELIIDGHDSRAEAIDIDDMIVKDSDKLFRFSRIGFGIYFKVFEREPASYLSWLSRVTEKWFFTATALRLAREQAAKREESLVSKLYETAVWPFCRCENR